MATNQQQLVEALEGKTDLEVVREMARSSSNLPTAFVPQTMHEMLEFSKIMATARGAVPPHLFGNAGSCLAVAMQAFRWQMDPFAVANKSFFVNERLAFEAQLINAVCNTRAPLVGRLHVEWQGEGNNLVCTVSGRLKGDERDKQVVQEIGSITTRNSPLWKQSPKQQLGYYTTRLWVRLYCPEVLLGVYSADELDGGELVDGGDGTYRPQASMASRPTRAQVTSTTVEPARLPYINRLGEEIGEFCAADWCERFLDEWENVSLEERTVIIDNNREIAPQWHDAGESDPMVLWNRLAGDLDLEKEAAARQRQEAERQAREEEGRHEKVHAAESKPASQGDLLDAEGKEIEPVWTIDMPSLMPRPTGGEQEAWLARAAAMLNLAPDARAVQAWVEANSRMIDRLGAQYLAKMNAYIENAYARLD